ncbi:MAG TPA: TRAP transporter substrate-binding protein [Candidatus Elarobacter sp.]|jgi:tripartite ATP-independent transporter DctP family solute receptor|nr:TRAP transporter substrate-binding protein [Candidatus Elarobacter sp.]
MPINRQVFVAGSAAAFASIGMMVPARAAQFSLKYGHDLPAEHPINVRSVEAFAKIKKETNGNVEIKSFPASVLGSDPSMIAQLRSGAVESLAMPGAFLNAIAPLASIENLAYAYPSRDVVFRAMDGDLGKVVRDDIGQKGGMVVLDKIWENGFREITTSTKPIHNVNDLAGLKIRVSPGKIRVDTFQSLGAAPTPIALSELYTSLQTHVIDAQENPLLLIDQQKFYEVQKYVSMSDHIWSGYWTLFNQDVWNKLGKSYQSIISREMGAAALLARNDNVNLNRSVRDKLVRRGMLFNDVDKNSFKQKLVAAKYYERWKAEFGPVAWAALEKYANKLA